MFIDVPNTKHKHWRIPLVDSIVIVGTVSVGGGSPIVKKTEMNRLSSAIPCKLTGIAKYRRTINRLLVA